MYDNDCIGEMTSLVMIRQHDIEIFKQKNQNTSEANLERYRNIVNIMYGKSYAPPIFMSPGKPEEPKQSNIASLMSSHNEPRATNTLVNHSSAKPRRAAWILPADLPIQNRPPDPRRFLTPTSRFTPETTNWAINSEIYACPPVYSPKASYFLIY